MQPATGTAQTIYSDDGLEITVESGEVHITLTHTRADGRTVPRRWVLTEKAERAIHDGARRQHLEVVALDSHAYVSERY